MLLRVRGDISTNVKLNIFTFTYKIGIWKEERILFTQIMEITYISNKCILECDNVGIMSKLT